MVALVDVEARLNKIPNHERESYLLGVIQALIEAQAEKVPDFITELPLSKRERRVVYRLAASEGRIVSREALNIALYADRHPSDWPMAPDVDRAISRARKVIPPNIGVIETIWGEGCIFRRAE